MRNLNIGMFTCVYHPIKSGVVNAVANFTQGLRILEQDVYVFAPRYPRYTDSDSQVVRLSSLGIKKVDFRISYKPMSRRARSIIKNLDIIHSHHPTLLGAIAKGVAKKHGLPLVLTTHSHYELYHQYFPYVPDQIFTWLVRTRLKHYAAHCDCIIAPTEEIMMVLKSYGIKKRIALVPNGIDLARFRTGDRRALRSMYGIGPDEVVATFVGRIAKEKNVATLLGYYKQAQRKAPFRLMIIGAGPLLAKSRRQASRMGLARNVIFTGPVDNSDMHHYLAASDLFVTASSGEVHPLSVLEALASGLPVVAVNVNGMRHIIDDGTNGFLCKATGRSYSDCLTEIVTNTSLRKELARNARQSSKPYSIEATSKKLLEVYRTLVP